MKNYLYITIFLLLCMVGALVFWKKHKAKPYSSTQENEQVSKPQGNRISSKNRFKIPGIGLVEYDSILEDIDLREYCKNFLPERYTDENAQLIKINVYLKGDKIVYICKNKGMYPSENRAEQVLKIAQNGEIDKHGHIASSGGIVAITHKESWLDINDAEAIAVVQKYLFDRGWDKKNKEAELVPIYVKAIPDLRGRVPAKFMNKTFQGLYYRTCNGRPNSDTPYNDAKYPFDESYLWRYSIISMLQDEQGKWTMNGPASHTTYPEGSLEAVEKYKHIFEERARKKRESR